MPHPLVYFPHMLTGGGKRVKSFDGTDHGANWATGTQSQPTVTSPLFFEGAVSSTDMNRVTDAREKQRIGIFSTVFSYAGSHGGSNKGHRNWVSVWI
jgi:hypothetical protein